MLVPIKEGCVVNSKDKDKIKHKNSKQTTFPAENIDINVIHKDSASLVQKTSLNIVIKQLISKYQLTQTEVSAYLVEQNSIQETEYEINKAISSLISKGDITIKEFEDLQILELASKSQSGQNDKIISRELSVEWINQNTHLNDFFLPTRPYYNNLIKNLNQNNNNYYFLEYSPNNNMEVEHNGRLGVMFSSNDYLGLANHPKVVAAAKESIDRYGIGGRGSRISIGTSQLHLDLEKSLSDFNSLDSTTILSSGYLTNLSLLSMINKNSLVFFDSLAHACIIDGIKLVGATPIRFKHNDVNDLERKLEKYKNHRNKLIFVESIYSLDGDICPIQDVIALSKQFNAYLAVDEAHSIGTMGKSGRGITEHFSLNKKDIHFKVGTLSKALGSEGGYFCTDKYIMEAFKYTHTPYMFTTSRSFPAVAAAKTAIEVMQEEPHLITRLQNSSAFIRSEILKMGYNIGDSESQIIPILIPDDKKVFELQQFLFKNGLFTVAAVYPTVPPRKSRVRINISAAHTDNQLHKLLDLLQDFRKSF